MLKNGKQHGSQISDFNFLAADGYILFINHPVSHLTDRGVTRVDDVVTTESINERSLERLFNEYVGVGPKWVI